VAEPDDPSEGRLVAPGTTGLVLALSATPSLFLLAVTNRISQEIAVIPFLWVAPLTVYLMSFILAFSGRYRHDRRVFAGLFIALTVLNFAIGVFPTAMPVYWQIVANCLLLFAVCMICHAEVYRLRPVAARLTSFYLVISVGGALGGAFVSLVAPLIFAGYWEFFVGLAMTIAILVVASRDELLAQAPARPALTVLAVFVFATLTPAVFRSAFHGALFAERNFYGVVRVPDVTPAMRTSGAYIMTNGVTVHGLQFIDPDRRGKPTAYYTRDSGAGLAIVNHPRYEKGMRVGLLGLGIGTLTAYGRSGDEYRGYEINPVVDELAHGRGDYFSFLRDSEARITTVIGDARLSLEREVSAGQAPAFDVLVLDTFNSDSIPVHMLTREAFALYLKCLAPGGILAAHITNRHLNLQPVLWQLARHHGLHIMRVDYPGDEGGGYASEWVLLARERDVLDQPAIRDRATDLAGYSTDLALWTDDYSNLFQILR
jgi:tryptophan-rich sensory protein